MSHPVFLVNPAAQGGKCGPAWRAIEPRVGDVFPHYEVRETARPGDSRELTREALESGATLIVSVGGDGTHSAVASAFFDGPTNRFPAAALGLLPVGTGGDLARGLGLGRDPGRAIEALRRPPRPFDAGHLSYTRPDGSWGEQVFINACTAGLGGEVVRRVSRMPGLLGGWGKFFAATILSMAGYRASRIEVTVDGRPVTSAAQMNLAVCNGAYIGSGMWIAPRAVPDDGLFDVVSIEGGSLSALKLVRAVYRGTHVQRDFVRTWRGREVAAKGLDGWPVRLDVDGEQPGALPARWRILPGALRLVY